jgi:mono/diheme cytochrome c family protein
MNATAAAVREGSILFKRYCYYCHGVGAVSGSSIPDLRYATAETYDQFQSIVLGGDLEYGGMPSFKDALKLARRNCRAQWQTPAPCRKIYLAPKGNS